jgi:hypothetical protein
MPSSAFPKFKKDEESTYTEDTSWEDESGDTEEVRHCLQVLISSLASLD